MRNLRYVSTAHSSITDAGFSHLSSLTRLICLHIDVQLHLHVNFQRMGKDILDREACSLSIFGICPQPPRISHLLCSSARMNFSVGEIRSSMGLQGGAASGVRVVGPPHAAKCFKHSAPKKTMKNYSLKSNFPICMAHVSSQRIFPLYL